MYPSWVKPQPCSCWRWYCSV